MSRLPLRHLARWSVAPRHHADHADTYVIKYVHEGREVITSNIVCWKESSHNPDWIAIRTRSFRTGAVEDFFISLADAKTPAVLIAFRTVLAHLEWRG